MTAAAPGRPLVAFDAAPCRIACPSPLLAELQNSRKMQSLDSLGAKLGEDRHRHVAHANAVQQGLVTVHSGQSAASLVTSEDAMTKLGSSGGCSYPDKVRARIVAARSANASPVADPEAADCDESVAQMPSSSSTAVAPERTRTLQFQPPSSADGALHAERCGDVIREASRPVGPPPGGPISPASRHRVRMRTGESRERAPPTEERSMGAAERCAVVVRTDTCGFHITDVCSFSDTAERQACGVPCDPLLRPVQPENPCVLKHVGEVAGFAFSPDGRRVVAGGEKCLMVWDLQDRNRKLEVKMRGEIQAVAYGPLGLFVATADSESFVTTWSAQTLDQHAQVVMDGHIQSMATVESPKALVAVGTTAEKCVLLSMPNLEEIAHLQHDGLLGSVSFSANGGLLAGGGAGIDTDGIRCPRSRNLDARENKVAVWHVSAKGTECRHAGSMSCSSTVRAVAFSLSSNLLAVGGEFRAVSIFVVEDSSCAAKAAHLPCPAGVRCIAWSSDSRFLASGGEDMQITVWNVFQRRVAFQLPKTSDWLCSVAFSPSTVSLACCCYGDTEVNVHPMELIQMPDNPSAMERAHDDSGVQGVHEAVTLAAQVSTSIDLDQSTSDAQDSGLTTRRVQSVPAEDDGMAAKDHVLAHVQHMASSGSVNFSPKGADESAARKQARHRPSITMRIPDVVPAEDVQDDGKAQVPADSQTLYSAGTVKFPVLPAEQPAAPQDDAIVRSERLSFTMRIPDAVPAFSIQDEAKIQVPADSQPLYSFGTVKFAAPDVDSARTTQQDASGSIIMNIPPMLPAGDFPGDAIPSDPVALSTLPSGDHSVPLTSQSRQRCATILVSTTRPRVHLDHEDEVMDVAFSPDGAHLLAGGEDMQVTVWDMSSRTKYFTQQMSGAIKAVAFSPSGLYFAAGDTNSIVTVWELSVGSGFNDVAPVTVEGEIHTLCFRSSPTELIAVGTSSHKVVLLSPPSLIQVAVVTFHAEVRSLSFSPDGTLLAAGGGADDSHGLVTRRMAAGSGFRAVIWRVSATGSELQPINDMEYSDVVHAITFSPCGKWLAVGGESRSITTHNVSRDFEKLDDLTCAAGIRAMAWSADSRLLASAGEDMQITLWDVAASRVALQMPKAKDWYCSIAFSPCSSWLASCGFGDNTVSLHPMDVSHCSNTELENAVISIPLTRHRTLNEPLHFDALKSSGTVKFSPVAGDVETDYIGWAQSAETPVSSDIGSPVSKLDRRDSIVCNTLKIEDTSCKLVTSTSRERVSLRYQDEVMGLAFSMDGRYLVAGGEDCELAVWDVHQRAKCFSSKCAAPIVAVAYSPCGAYFAAADLDATVAVWRSGSHEKVGSARQDGSIRAIAMASILLAAGTSKKKVRLLSAQDMELVADVSVDGDVRSLSFSPDGVQLAAGCGTDEKHGLRTNKQPDTHGMKTVIWQLSSGGSTCAFLGCALFSDIVHAVSFSPSGKVLAVGGEDSTVSLLLVAEDFKRLSEYTCAAGVRCLAWSRDSRFLASAGEDMQITVWDLAHHRVAFQMPKARDWYCGLAFSPCCSWLASCGYGMKEVVLHPLELEVVPEIRDSYSPSHKDRDHLLRTRTSSKDLCTVHVVSTRVGLPQSDCARLSNSLPTVFDRDLLKCAGSVKFDELDEKEGRSSSRRESNPASTEVSRKGRAVCASVEIRIPADRLFEEAVEAPAPV